MLDALGNDKHVERLCNVNISSQDQQYKVLKGNNLRYGIWESAFLFLIIQFLLLLLFLNFWELNAGCSGQDVGVWCLQGGPQPFLSGCISILVLKTFYGYLYLGLMIFSRKFRFSLQIWHSKYGKFGTQSWVSAVNIWHHHANVDYFIILAVTQIANYQIKENR